MASQNLEKRILELEKKVTSLQEGKISDKTITGLRNNGFLTTKDFAVGVVAMNGLGVGLARVTGASIKTVVLCNQASTTSFGFGGFVYFVGAPNVSIFYVAILNPVTRGV